MRLQAKVPFSMPSRNAARLILIELTTGSALEVTYAALSRLSGCGAVHATETRVLNQQMGLSTITDRNRDEPVLLLDYLAACQQEGR